MVTSKQLLYIVSDDRFLIFVSWVFDNQVLSAWCILWNLEGGLDQLGKTLSIHVDNFLTRISGHMLTMRTCTEQQRVLALLLRQLKALRTCIFGRRRHLLLKVSDPFLPLSFTLFDFSITLSNNRRHIRKVFIWLKITHIILLQHTKVFIHCICQVHLSSAQAQGLLDLFQLNVILQCANDLLVWHLALFVLPMVVQTDFVEVFDLRWIFLGHCILQPA